MKQIKMLQRIRLLLLCCVLLPLTACDSEPITKTGFMMDTFVTVTVYDKSDPQILEDAFALCAQYEAQLSRTVPDSEVWRLNHAQGKPLTVSEELRALLAEAIFFSELTEGRYDVTICPVVDLWDFSGANSVLPDPEAIEIALRQVGYRNILLDGDSAQLLNGAQIDLGSIAKGYIADRLGEFLRGQGVGSAVIDLGGNILTVGSRPNGTQFRIGLQQPFAERNVTIGTVQVSDLSIVSSGIYERGFTLDGRRYHHILDPATGYPAETGLSGVSVITRFSMDADALSTCLYLLGPEEGLALAESLPGVEAVLIAEDGEKAFTSGFGSTLPYTPGDERMP